MGGRREAGDGRGGGKRVGGGGGVGGNGVRPRVDFDKKMRRGK